MNDPGAGVGRGTIEKLRCEHAARSPSLCHVIPERCLESAKTCGINGPVIHLKVYIRVVVTAPGVIKAIRPATLEIRWQGAFSRRTSIRPFSR